MNDENVLRKSWVKESKKRKVTSIKKISTDRAVMSWRSYFSEAKITTRNLQMCKRKYDHTHRHKVFFVCSLLWFWIYNVQIIFPLNQCYTFYWKVFFNIYFISFITYNFVSIHDWQLNNIIFFHPLSSHFLTNTHFLEYTFVPIRPKLNHF